MTNIAALPRVQPDWEMIVQRSAELGALLLAIHTASTAYDERDRLPDAMNAAPALNEPALRLHGEFDEMVRRAVVSGRGLELNANQCSW